MNLQFVVDGVLFGALITLADLLPAGVHHEAVGDDTAIWSGAAHGDTDHK